MNGIFFFIVLSVLISAPLFAQEPGGNSMEEYPLTVAIVGTASYSDVNVMIKNLKRSSQIGRLSASQSKRDLSEFSGTYKGSPESLIDEVRGLAQDRFAVEVPKQKGKQSGALNLTLRKISSETPN